LLRVSQLVVQKRAKRPLRTVTFVAAANKASSTSSIGSSKLHQGLSCCFHWHHSQHSRKALAKRFKSAIPKSPNFKACHAVSIGTIASTVVKLWQSVPSLQYLNHQTSEVGTHVSNSLCIYHLATANSWPIRISSGACPCLYRNASGA
jgi:hypothetical protein